MPTDTLETVCAQIRREQLQSDTDRRYDTTRALHDKAARLFAKGRGWRATQPRALIDIDQLNRLRGPGWPKPRCADWFTLDHSRVFLGPKGKIIGFIAQPYDFEREEFDELTDRLGLRMEIIGTQLSWHYPGKTTLLVFTPRTRFGFWADKQGRFSRFATADGWIVHERAGAHPQKAATAP